MIAKKYTHVLVDIDNTILDFNECARQGIIEGFKDINKVYKDCYFEEFLRTNEILWQQFENKIITNEYLHKIRFNTIFNNLGLDIDGLAFEAKFRDRLKVSHIPVKDAKLFLDYLSSKYVLAAASNGSFEQQVDRLSLSNFYPYFSSLFVSSSVGFQKPDARFFNKVIESLNVKKENIILIGDSLSADIQGGINAGIDTIWYNPKNIKGSIPATFEINALMDITKIL